MRGWMVVWCALAACEPRGSCEPDIAEDAQHRDSLAAGWEEFRDYLREPLCVRRIRTAEEIPLPRWARGVEGVYVGGRATRTPTGTRIEIAERSDPEAVRGTLVHELCHAVSYQHESAREGPGWPVVDGIAQRSAREEAFAQWCDFGADGTALVAQLPDLTDTERSALQFLLDEVYAPTAIGPRPAAWPSIALEVDVAVGPLRGFADGLLVLDGRDDGHLLVDLSSGEVMVEQASQVDVFQRGASGLDTRGMANLSTRDAFEHQGTTVVHAGVILPNRRTWEAVYARSDGAGPVLLTAVPHVDDVTHQLALGLDGVAVFVTHNSVQGRVDIDVWDLDDLR